MIARDGERIDFVLKKTRDIVAMFGDQVPAIRKTLASSLLSKAPGSLQSIAHSIGRTLKCGRTDVRGAGSIQP